MLGLNSVIAQGRSQDHQEEDLQPVKAREAEGRKVPQVSNHTDLGDDPAAETHQGHSRPDDDSLIVWDGVHASLVVRLELNP